MVSRDGITPGEHAVKAVETATKESEYYINLVDTAVTSFERTDSNSERCSTVGEMLSHIQRNHS